MLHGLSLANVRETDEYTAIKKVSKKGDSEQIGSSGDICVLQSGGGGLNFELWPRYRSVRLRNSRFTSAFAGKLDHEDFLSQSFQSVFIFTPFDTVSHSQILQE